MSYVFIQRSVSNTFGLSKRFLIQLKTVLSKYSVKTAYPRNDQFINRKLYTVYKYSLQRLNENRRYKGTK